MNGAPEPDEFARAVTAAADVEPPRSADSAAAPDTATATADVRTDEALAANEPDARDAAHGYRNEEQRVEDAPPEILPVHRPRAHAERKAPLTRLPLRARTSAVVWPRLLEPGVDAFSREARHRLLEEMTRADAPPHEAVLIAAYREEDAEGRTLALRGLRHRTSNDARAIFEEALRDGLDEERAAAVDALAAGGARESLAAALSDPVDAIAARAALAYVGSRERADYHLALSPFVDSARIETLLSLLAGYLA